MVLFIMLYVVLTCVTNQIKAVEQYFPVAMALIYGVRGALTVK